MKAIIAAVLMQLLIALALAPPASAQPSKDLPVNDVFDLCPLLVPLLPQPAPWPPVVRSPPPPPPERMWFSQDMLKGVILGVLAMTLVMGLQGPKVPFGARQRFNAVVDFPAFAMFCWAIEQLVTPS